MVPPVTQEELNGGSITRDTPSVEDVAPDLDIEADLAPIPITFVASTPSSTKRQLPSNWLGEKLYVLSTAALIGILTGTNIAVFKTAVELVREALYGDGVILPFLNPALWNELKGEDILTITLRISETIPIWLIPAFGGILVGLLLTIGDMPPGLRDTVKEVDLDSMRATNATPPDELLACVNLTPASERNDLARFSRKAVAATLTLGTGNSLGPEGPSVEAGMSLSRLLMNNKIFGKVSRVFGTLEDMELSEMQRVNRKVARDRLLLACGAAAGVSAGFNAPLSGVFFALEIVQNSLVPIDFPLKQAANTNSNIEQKSEIQVATVGGEALALQQINISAILLASVVSALTIQLLLGNELALRLGSFDFKNPLIELPLYLLLGALAGVTAAIFSGVAQLSKSTFDGK
ncbi:CLC voltage-gated chloride channel [Skeletonema marinoi]|uniref:CLC voltage-gated chloride channel n=1 Tax=Skeletonema marinoi TaxID=267567 RepID=A0AAD8YPY7_9STRA|nr:CLC voltage-gated chloride channel [Skeletonema marinoi]